MLRASFAPALALLLLALGSCTVYVPMQPVAPSIRQAYQSEFIASVQPTGRVEATAAYSPASRVLVTGGVTEALRLSDTQFLETGQYETGLGYYQPLKRHWVLSGVGGFGQAYSHRGYLGGGIFGAQREYEARYRKAFGQLGAVYQGRVYGCGITYRFTGLNFDYLNDSKEGPLLLSSAVWHELTFTNRIRLASHWQLLNVVGFSTPGTPQLSNSSNDPAYNRRVNATNNNLTPVLLLSLGVAYRLGPGTDSPGKKQSAAIPSSPLQLARRGYWVSGLRRLMNQ